jgi:hypothetical protein
MSIKAKKTSLLLAGLVGVVSCSTPSFASSLLSGYRVESPSSMPPLAQQGGTDLYLYSSAAGDDYLIVEADTGRSVSVLDVTDPAHILAMGTAAIDGKGAFDFVKSVGRRDILIRYRGDGNYAILDVTHPGKPLIVDVAALSDAGNIQDNADLLVVSADAMLRDAPTPRSAMTYRLLDVSNGEPTDIATIAGAKARAFDPTTCTTYFLTDHGITAVRDLTRETQNEAAARIENE